MALPFPPAPATALSPQDTFRLHTCEPSRLLTVLSSQLSALETRPHDNAVYWQSSAILSDLCSIRTPSNANRVDGEIKRAEALLYRGASTSFTADIKPTNSARTLVFRSFLTANLDDDSESDEYDSDVQSVLTDLHAEPLRTQKYEQEEELDQYHRPVFSPVKEAQSDTILQSDRVTHQALSHELLRMAGVLKSNSLAFASSLERDRMLVEKAGEHLSGNLDLITRTRGKLGIYSKKARNMGCFTLAAILIVITSWIFMFFIIRLT